MKQQAVLVIALVLCALIILFVHINNDYGRPKPLKAYQRPVRTIKAKEWGTDRELVETATMEVDQ